MKTRESGWWRLAGPVAAGVFVAAFLLMLPGRTEGGSTVANHGRKETATLGGGCFWCMEAVYERLPGVLSVTSGYAGGSVPNPTYEQVCGGKTGHAEVVQIEYDPARITYGQILDLFWQAHDPTTKDRQGADAGHQYRSIILFSSEAQQAEAVKSAQSAAATYSSPIVTEIVPLEKFYRAEEYHQHYFQKNPNAAYCALVIAPKLKKLPVR